MKRESSNSFIASRAKSIGHAVDGILEMLRTQHNAWIHLAATMAVVTLGIAFEINALDWCLLVFAIVFVWVTEALNTALEYLCDIASPDFHPLVKKSKDVAAGAVLICATGSVVVGCLVFYPYLSR